MSGADLANSSQMPKWHWLAICLPPKVTPFQKCAPRLESLAQHSIAISRRRIHQSNHKETTSLIPKFTLFTLLGFRFAPRLRDLSDQTLYRARKGVDYALLTPTLKKDIEVHLIMEHWNDLN